MPSRRKYDGLPRPSKQKCGGTTGLEAHRTPWIVGIVVLLLWVLAANPNALADERDDAVEKLALELDSASGLLAARSTKGFLGARSCAAAACHGGVDPDPRFELSRRNEYAFWLDKDPHARAYRTLQNELSTAILARLARPSDDDQARANRLANCFGCHNPQPAAAQQAVTFYEREGVSCEICHSPAEEWIGAHVTLDWKKIRGTSLADKVFSFVSTKSIGTRAMICAQCHVGSPGREVNHDLIAAGHPALKFELTSYYAMLPKHWRDEAERKANPNFEITLWQAGQNFSGTAAIDLLKWRAERAEKQPGTAVWPEFAEYDCFACHHDLVHPSWRQAVATSTVPLGMPAWGSWYFSRLKSPSGKRLQDLADKMQGSFRPDPTAIINALNWVRLVSPQIDAVPDPATSWDDAAQQYLALMARAQAQRDAGLPDDAELTAAIGRLREQLAFPTKRNSPNKLFVPGDSTADRDQVHQSLLNRLKQPQQRGEE